MVAIIIDWSSKYGVFVECVGGSFNRVARSARRTLVLSIF